MGRRKEDRRKRRRRPSGAWRPRSAPGRSHLETTSVREIVERAELTAEQIRWYQEFAAELTTQRAAVSDALRAELVKASIGPFVIPRWQRAVRYKYTLNPLSTAGSVTGAGQRFNFGAETANLYEPFHALYLASDKETAMKEVLGQDEPPAGLTAFELALANPASISIVSISGVLDSVIDLRKEGPLAEFARILSGFKLTARLRREAKVLALKSGLVIDERGLLTTLLEPKWRLPPMGWDVPANSQIFGQMVRQAGIQGIVYPSKFGGACTCLAVFPSTFEEASPGTHLRIDDDAPSAAILTRIDRNNWQYSDLPSMPALPQN